MTTFSALESIDLDSGIGWGQRQQTALCKARFGKRDRIPLGVLLLPKCTYHWGDRSFGSK